MKRYTFTDISTCEMCGDPTGTHKILGQRINRSQGYRPKKNIGISVTVQQCNRCSLIYSNPQPVPFDIQDHYGTPPEAYWIPEYFLPQPDYFSHQINTAKSLLAFNSGMKALDIGAGLGKAMLSMDRSGFDAYGFEPSIPFYEKAIAEMNINPDKLKLGAIETLEYEPETFDFISFGSVFEHVYSPAACLQKALTWLKPNGIIHIEVPSSRWLMAKWMNVYYRLMGTTCVTNLSPMHAPFHLHEFDLDSFEYLAQKQGFVVAKHYYDVGDIYYIPKMFHPILNWYMKKTHTGMQLTVYLRKK